MMREQLLIWKMDKLYLVGKKVNEIPKVVSRVETEPLDLLHEYEARGEHHLCESDGVDAVTLVLVELDARVLQQVNAVLGVHVLGQVELEVELPRGYTVGRQVCRLVHESQAELDDLERVDIAPEQLILIVGRGSELT